eukprot:6535242-Prymnesium_polylepis.2
MSSSNKDSTRPADTRTSVAQTDRHTHVRTDGPRARATYLPTYVDGTGDRTTTFWSSQRHVSRARGTAEPRAFEYRLNIAHSRPEPRACQQQDCAS